MKDTTTNVKKLQTRVRRLIKSTIGTIKQGWESFLEEIKSWLRAARHAAKLVNRKWEQLRWAVECAEGAVSMLGTNFNDVGEQQIWENWEGYLMWIAKHRPVTQQQVNRESPYNVGYKGLLANSSLFKGTRNLKRLALAFRNTYLPNCKVRITQSYRTVNIEMNNREQDIKDATTIKDFLNQFNYDYSDSMTDYFSVGFSVQISS